VSSKDVFEYNYQSQNNKVNIANNSQQKDSNSNQTSQTRNLISNIDKNNYTTGGSTEKTRYINIEKSQMHQTADANYFKHNQRTHLYKNYINNINNLTYILYNTK